MMARSCKIRSDVRRRPEIDAQLLPGRALTLVAAKFQVSRSTLGRNSKLHMRERAARDLERVTVECSRRLRQSMNVIQDHVLQILAQARKDGNLPLALEAAQGGRENVETMRRLLVKTSDPRTKAKQAGREAPAEVVLEYEEVPHHVAPPQ